MAIPQHFETILSCPRCRGVVRVDADAYRCSACQQVYERRDGHAFFTDIARGYDAARADGIVYALKNFLKVRYPRVFFFLYAFAACFIGVRARAVAAAMPSEARMINVGSGAKRVHPAVVNIDLAPEAFVDIVASAYELPFADASIDLVVSESLLEHLEYPERAVAEMTRVLKPGGRIYILTPFMLGFHSSPNDFYRWTIPGMQVLLKDFTIEDAGVAIGPTSGMTAILREWLAMLLSFNSRLLFQFWALVFMALFIPVNWLDYLIGRYRMASQIALAYYWVGAKK